MGRIESISARAFRVPTDRHEQDGTLDWDSTTMVFVEARSSSAVGYGYTYCHEAAKELIESKLADELDGCDATRVRTAWRKMLRAVRNIGRPGIAACAISAVDTALWDLKAKLLEVPLVTLFDSAQSSTPAYGSGGFTSYSIDELCEQLRGWVDEGFDAVKMKVGRDAEADRTRVKAVREAIGDAKLMVDANGAYSRQQALKMASFFADQGVVWFEEPVSSDDLEGLRLLRDHGPPGLEITAGEYGYDPWYFARMLGAGAVDCLQADVTRCLGFTGYLEVGSLCEAQHVDLSGHTAPTLHAQVCPAVLSTRHVEYFWDHMRIERRFFKHHPQIRNGALLPNTERPGAGLEPRFEVMDEYAIE